MSDPNMDDINDLRTFLYLGTLENGIQGNLASKHSFEPVGAQYIKKLIQDGQLTEDQAVQEIVRFHKEGLFLRSDSLTYCLALCAHSRYTMGAAFKAAGDICKSATEMFAFVHFYTDISKPTSGWGRAHRTFLIDWYNGKEAKDLAAEILKVKSRHKWNHKDILCMTHVKPKDASTAAVLRYVLKGMEEVRKDFGSDASVEDILSYLEVLDQLKHTTDMQAAARLIEIHNFSYEYLPNHFFKSKEIWLCLTPRLPLNILLQKLPVMLKLGLLKSNSSHYKILLERLTSEDTLANIKIGPLEVFSAIKRLKHIINKNAIRKSGARPIPIPALEEALQNIQTASFKTVATTKKRYLVVLDRRILLELICLDKKCFGNSAVDTVEISYFVLMALVKSEISNVTTLGCSIEGLVQADIGEEVTMSEISKKLDMVLSCSVTPTSVLKWAKDHKEAFDLILVLTDLEPSQKDEEIIAALKDYRQSVNQPNTRFVICAFAAKEFTHSTRIGDGLLKISGHNMNLLKIIQDFACHVF